MSLKLFSLKIFRKRAPEPDSFKGNKEPHNDSNPSINEYPACLPGSRSIFDVELNTILRGRALLRAVKRESDEKGNGNGERAECRDH
jgi:hypothetical protein